jgi:hypothetical protein
LLFLTDWSSAIVQEEQLTDVTWKKTLNGPNSDLINDFLLKNIHIDIDNSSQLSNTEKVVRGLRDGNTDVFNEYEKGMLNFVFDTSQEYNDLGLKRIVNLTYPSLTSNFGEELDLVKLSGYSYRSNQLNSISLPNPEKIQAKTQHPNFQSQQIVV